MAANILAWLPGAVSHWQEQAGPGVEVLLGQPPAPEAVLPALVGAALAGARLPAAAVPASLGKPGWQHLPDFDTHILVCTGPRCCFRGAGTLAQRLKAQLAAAGLARRCLTTSTGCIYPCNQGPVIALYPQGEWYRVSDEAALVRVVHEAIGRGRRLADLLLEDRPQTRSAPVPERIPT
ncbi:MAG: (2Fe-2S) ferredoxin domain-containing protein [Rubellimicrobium sp.]|nr:(2Fe-2S) ferredoxin domain-containing protein [Rubellimicrobium sp.]